MDSTDSDTPRSLQPDEQLVAQAGNGRSEAIAELYERYFQPIYDFTLGNVRGNQMVAEDVVLITFEKAVGNLQKGTIHQSFKGWLYTTARHELVSQIRREQIADKHAVKLVTDVTETGSDPHRLLEKAELRHIVWEAMAALRPQERELLDLYMRQGFTAQEIANMRGISLDTFYTQRSRAKSAFKKAMFSIALMQQGRIHCTTLDELLTGMQAAELTRPVHKAIQKHMAACPQCQGNARRYAYPVAIFAGLDKVPVPPGLKDTLWERLIAQMNGATQIQNGQRTMRQQLRSARNINLFVPAGIIAALVMAIILLLAFWNRDTPPVPDPLDVHSTSHMIGETSRENVIAIAWTQQPEVKVYSILWSQAAVDLPNQVADLPGGATGTTSPPLVDGTWYFHLRTQGQNDVWTSTIHRGPYIIAANRPTDTPALSTNADQIAPSPSITPTLTPTPCVLAAGWVDYTVRPGDSYYALANKTNTTIEQIQQANCTNSDRLLAGQTLLLPFIPQVPFVATQIIQISTNIPVLFPTNLPLPPASTSPTNPQPPVATNPPAPTATSVPIPTTTPLPLPSRPDTPTPTEDPKGGT